MAKTGRFRCSKCDRRFKMAAHLARHMSTLHAAKASPSRKRTTKPVIKHGGRRRKAAGSTPRRPALGIAASVLNPLRQYQRQLVDQREALNSQIATIDAALAAMGGGVAVRKSRPARRRRSAQGPRPGTLKAYIERVLRARRSPVAVKDIAAGVLKAGFKTKHKRLTKSVGAALAEMPTAVKIGHGQYRLK